MSTRRDHAQTCVDAGFEGPSRVPGSKQSGGLVVTVSRRHSGSAQDLLKLAFDKLFDVVPKYHRGQEITLRGGCSAD